MRAPAFWQAAAGPANWRSWALAPLGWIYGRATARRLASGARTRAPVPVICVGNLSAGGTGKTPAVIALAEMARAARHTPHVVTKGYGGRVTGPLHVDPRRHTARQVGDEALLHAAFADTWVARDRLAGALAAAAAGASLVLLDDGFQDPALWHDLSVVVVDAQSGFGNRRCIPAGPLREPVHAGLARADVLLIVGDAPDIRPITRHVPDTVSVLCARLAPLQTGMDWAGLPVLAFAGIGRPEKFFDTLRDLGADVLRTEALDDHAPLSRALLTRLEREAASLGAQLVTTEKDAARLPAEFRGRVLSLPVRLTFADPSDLEARLRAL